MTFRYTKTCLMNGIIENISDTLWAMLGNAWKIYFQLCFMGFFYYTMF